MAETRKRRRLSASGASNADQDIPADDQESENSNGDHSYRRRNQRRTIFVRSLPKSTTTEALTDYFSQSYPLKHATVVLDPQTKQSRGYGFVTFADHEDAQRALEEFNGSLFGDRKIKIEIAEPRHREIGEKGAKSVPSAATSKLKEEKENRRLQAQPPKLIVRNLPWSVEVPEQLEALFRSFGKVKHAVIPRKGAGRAGFGFVTMRGRKNAQKAIEAVNGKEVDGRTLAVDWAVEKSIWERLHKATGNSTDETNHGLGEEAKHEDKGSPEGDGGGELSGQDEADDNFPVRGLDTESHDDDDISLADVNGHDSENKILADEVEDTRNAATIFIRNLPFTATDDTVYDHFTRFGPLRYARIVVDPDTERPKGTAFVCFWKAEDAALCLREAPRRTDLMSSEDRKNKSSRTSKHSILEDENKDYSGRYTIDGRVLQISQAVTRREAVKLEAEGISRRDARDKDKRRLYLLSEGTIHMNSPLYSKLSPTEIKMREASAKQRQKLIKSNPMLHISLTRLSVRNISRNIDSKGLKALAREAVVGFAKDVKNGIHQPLSQEELRRSAEVMKEAERRRKSQGKGIVKQAKVVFEGREGSKISEKTGAGRSRGYGFIEYTSHRSALMGLRWLNGHAVSASPTETGVGAKKKRLIVEFAIENAQVVNRRQERELKSRNSNNEANRKTQTRGAAMDSANPPERSPKQGIKRKRLDGAQDKRSAHSAIAAPDAADERKKRKDNQLAKRNRVILKKRMMRKARKDS